MHKAIVGILGIAVVAVAASKFTNFGPEPEPIAIMEDSVEVFNDDDQPMLLAQKDEKAATSFDPPRKSRSFVNPKTGDKSAKEAALEELEKMRAERIKKAITKSREVEKSEMKKSEIEPPMVNKAESKIMKDVEVQTKPMGDAMAGSVKPGTPGVISGVIESANPGVIQGANPGVIQGAIPSVLNPGVQVYDHGQANYGQTIFVEQMPVTEYVPNEIYTSGYVPSASVDQPAQKPCKLCDRLGVYGQMSPEQLWQGYKRPRW